MYIAFIDLNNIKSFIYAAPSLRTMRGSSHIIAEYNAWDRLEKSIRDNNGLLLVAGGGTTLAKFSEIKGAQNFIQTEQEKLFDLTHGSITFSHVIQEIKNNDLEKAIINAQRALDVQKQCRQPPLSSVNHFLVKPCRKCGKNPSELIWEGIQLCPACMERVKQGASGSNPISEFIQKKLLKSNNRWAGAQPANDLQSLASISGNYLGFIQADGNAMGERLRLLSEIGDEELMFLFSKKVYQTVQNALSLSIASSYPHPISFQNRQLTLPYEIVQSGGDDLTLITPANYAIPIALSFCQIFTNEMKIFAEKIKKPELAVAMSAGVVIAKSTFPVYIMDELASQLLRNAKQLSHKITKKLLTPTIDFQVVSASMTSDINHQRQTYYKHDNFYLTQRPFTLSHLKNLLSILHIMKFPVNGKIPFPRNKLYDLYRASFSKPLLAEFNLQYLRSRLAYTTERPHRKMLDDLLNSGKKTDTIPASLWRQMEITDPENIFDIPYHDTLLTDAVELYDFIPEVLNMEEDANDPTS